MDKSNKIKRKRQKKAEEDENQMQEFVENSLKQAPLDENKDEDPQSDQDDEQVANSEEDSSDADQAPKHKKKAKSEQKSFGTAISTILGSSEQNETVVPLSKSRKAIDEQRKRKQLAEKEEKEKEMRKYKQQLANKTHVVPEVLNTTEEHKLKKIATLGVVQLFNAIAKHQSENPVEDSVPVGSSKKNFMEALKSQSKAQV